MNQWQKAREEAEEIRLLYVAATRAQRRLIIPWFAEKGERLDLLRRGFEPKPGELVEVVEVHQLVGDLKEPSKAASSHRTPKELIAKRQAWLAEHEALLARASKPLARVSPSKLAGEVERGEEEFVEVVRERAMEFGLAVHEALEKMDADVIARSALSDADKKRATEMVERALRSDLLRRAQQAEQVYRELPFTLMTDDGLMEGKIDLLFCEKGKWVLVDYKTDAQVDVKRYVEQMRAYESALKQIARDHVGGEIALFSGEWDGRTGGRMIKVDLHMHSGEDPEDGLTLSGNGVD